MAKFHDQNSIFIFDIPIKYDIRYIVRYLKWIVKSALCYLIFFLFPKKSIKKKYYISICAIFKNEAPFMKEWIEYHLLLGINHFYLYNNNSNDNYKDVLEPYIKKGKVTLIDWPETPGQMTAYKNWYYTYRNESNWVSFLDLDEFICPRYEIDLTTWLKKFKRYPVIMIYWKMFGTSGQISNEYSQLVTEQYHVSWEKLVNIGKLLYNTDYDIEKFSVGMMHSFNVKYHGLTIPPINQFKYFVMFGIHVGRKADYSIQVNHYWSKSFNCYLEKHKRGDASFEKSPRDLEYFLWHEHHNISSDYSAFRYIIQLKKRLNILK